MTPNNHFKIIIPSYNNEKWLDACLKSVKLQNYDNYQCIVVDDCSSDKSIEVIKEEINKNVKFLLITNKERKLALRNIYEAIEKSKPQDEDIIITLDGDDWFATKNVLATLNKKYEEADCWISYGSYIEYPSRQRGKFSREIPKEIIEANAFRESEWMSSHLRSFKYKLWKKIKKEDLLDQSGEFYKMTWDMAFMFPMLEMAANKSKYIEETLYVYNLNNPLNDHKVDNALQVQIENYIRSKEKYARLLSDN